MKTTLKTLSALAIAAATLTAVTLASSSAASAHPLNGAHRLPLFNHQPVFSCLACNLPRPHQTWNTNPWRFHQFGYFPGRYYGWEHRYDRYRWNYRDRFGFERRPVELGAVAAAAPATVSAPAQASAGPQGCLTEQKMPDGSVMFADVCKQISAIAAPASADPRQ